MGECRLAMVFSIRPRRGEVEVAGPDGCNVRQIPALSVTGTTAWLDSLRDTVTFSWLRQAYVTA